VFVAVTFAGSRTDYRVVGNSYLGITSVLTVTQSQEHHTIDLNYGVASCPFESLGECSKLTTLPKREVAIQPDWRISNTHPAVS
jgi:hypothetical protein